MKTKKSAFTLIELIIVIMILGILIPSIFSIYSFIIKANREIHARQYAIQQGYGFFEKLNIWMQDYTIDYEEYYNRQMVGCVWDSKRWTDFKWNIWTTWHCTNFTAYGNYNSIGNVGEKSHDIYYCYTGSNRLKRSYPKVASKTNCGKLWTRQSYGQYEALFTNVKKDTDNDSNIVWDSDDENLWYAMNNIMAIQDANNVQELYLISNDGKTRLFFRRKLKQIDGEHSQYVIQMLRLRWFDAWYQHNFAAEDKKWMYDWKIDTWACDAWMGFICNWSGLNGSYEGYSLPSGVDDGWIDVTNWPINVYTRNLSVSPVVSPDLTRADARSQINPYVSFLSVFWIYVPYYSGRMADSIVNFKVPIQTTINTKKFYKEPKN